MTKQKFIEAREFNKLDTGDKVKIFNMGNAEVTKAPYKRTWRQIEAAGSKLHRAVDVKFIDGPWKGEEHWVLREQISEVL